MANDKPDTITDSGTDANTDTPPTRRVILQCYDGHVEDSVRRGLFDTEEEQERLKDIELVTLRDILLGTRADLAEHTQSQWMARNIGREHLGEHDAIIWAPSGLCEDWFERLVREGHDKVRILLRDGTSPKDLDHHATKVLKMPDRLIPEKLTRILEGRIDLQFGEEYGTDEEIKIKILSVNIQAPYEGKTTATARVMGASEHWQQWVKPSQTVKLEDMGTHWKLVEPEGLWFVLMKNQAGEPVFEHYR